MKAVRLSVLSVIALAGFALAAEAFAHGRGGYYHPRPRTSVSIGIGVGPGYWYPPPPYYRPWYRAYYYAPYYGPYYAPAIVVPAAPTVYIEQTQPAPAAPLAQAAPADAYWYFCAESQAYYPYVKDCAGPWQRVSPIPPPR